MTQQQQQKQINISTDLSDIEKILDSTEGKEYLAICEVSKRTTREQILSTEIASAQFRSDYNIWIAGGKPLPIVPKSSDQIQIPAFLVKIMSRGKEYLYVEYQSGEKTGVKHNTTFAKETHPISGEQYTTTVVESRVPVYSIPFTESAAKKWIKTATDLVPPTLSYDLLIVAGDRSYSVSEKNFLKPYQEIMEMINRKESII